MIGALIDWLCWKPDDLHTGGHVVVIWAGIEEDEERSVSVQSDVIQSNILSLQSFMKAC